MGKFKNLLTEKVIFSRKGSGKFNLVLSVESKDNTYIITYLDNNIKRVLQITEKSLKDYTFLERTKNLFYKKYDKIDDINSLVNEMDAGGSEAGGISTDVAGVGGTAPNQFSSDFYAPGDARNIFGSGEGGSKKKKKDKKKKKFPMVKRPKIETILLRNATGGK